MEDYKLVNDAQEGFRRFQNVNCLKSSLITCILAGQRWRKTGLSVFLFWDIQIIDLSSSSYKPKIFLLPISISFVGCISDPSYQ